MVETPRQNCGIRPGSSHKAFHLLSLSFRFYKLCMKTACGLVHCVSLTNPGTAWSPLWTGLCSEAQSKKHNQGTKRELRHSAGLPRN